MLSSTEGVLKKAYKGKYAVGAFNINNLEIMQGILCACEKYNYPALLQTSQGAIKYAGLKYLYSLAQTANEIHKIPVCLHLDHGRDMDVIRKCINIGYSSVMIDGSHLNLKRISK